MFVNDQPFSSPLFKQHGPTSYRILGRIVLLDGVTLPGGDSPGERLAYQMGLRIGSSGHA